MPNIHRAELESTLRWFCSMITVAGKMDHKHVVAKGPGVATAREAEGTAAT
jgi:hypothetical protein